MHFCGKRSTLDVSIYVHLIRDRHSTLDIGVACFLRIGSSGLQQVVTMCKWGPSGEGSLSFLAS